MKRERAVLYLGQFILTFFLNLVYIGTYYQMDDEAVCIHAVQRILGGEIPYRDFTSDITPGSYYLSLPFFALCGFDPAAVRGLLALVAAAIGLPVQFLAFRTLRGNWVYLPWLLWATCGIATHPILSYHWYSSLTICLGACCLLRWQQQGRRSDALLVGLCGGVAFWVLQSAGFTLALASLVIWLRFRPAGLPWVGLGAALTSLILWAPFFPWRELIWQENFQVMGHHLATRRTSFLFDLGPQALKNFLEQPGLFSFSNCWLAWLRYTLFYPFLLVGLVAAERARDRPATVVSWVLACWCLTFLPRQTVPYVGYPGPLALLVACSLLARVRGSLWPKLLAVLATVSFFGQWSGLRARFIYPVQSRSGLYWSEDARDSLMAQQVHEWVEHYLPAGSMVFAYPYFTSLYTTEFLRNPTREFLFVEGIFPMERFRACIQRLRDNRVEYIVVQPLSAAAVADVCSATEEDYKKVRSAWLAELLEDYELFQTRGNVTLYRRRAGK